MKFNPKLALLTLAIFIHTLSSATVNGQEAVISQIRSIMFSPDGSRIAITSTTAIEIYDQDFHLIKSMPQDPNYPRFVYEWHPNSRQLRLNDQLYDSDTLEPVSGTGQSGGWSPDGLLRREHDRDDWTDLLIYDTTQNVVIQRIPTDLQFVETPIIWSSDSTQLMSPFWNGPVMLVIMDIKEGRVTAEYPVDGWIHAAVWSPDSRQIAAVVSKRITSNTSDSQTTTSDYQIDIIDAETGALVQRLGPLPSVSNSLYWTFDQNNVIAEVGINQIMVWDTNTDQLIETFTSQAAIGASDLRACL